MSKTSGSYHHKIEEKIPNPGSPEAIDKGCACPVLDNHYGKGFRVGIELHFWRNTDCPLHNKSKGGNEN